MRLVLRFGLLLVVAASLWGCGGDDSVDDDRSAPLDARGYLLQGDGTAFSRGSILEAAEVVSSGTDSYSVRFLLKDPPADDDTIEVAAKLGGSEDLTKLFVLRKANLTAGANSVYWATLNTTGVEAPLALSPLLATQIRDAALRGQWFFKHIKGSMTRASGSLLPGEDTPLSVTVPDASLGFTQRSLPFGTLKARASGITVNASIPISNAAALGKVASAELVVLASNDSSSDVVYTAPIAFAQSESRLVLSSELTATANDLSPDFDTHIKYLAVGIQRGSGFLSLKVDKTTVDQDGVSRTVSRIVHLKVGMNA